MSLGELFSGQGHAQKLVDPVYSGGPLAAEAIFALVRRLDGPGAWYVLEPDGALAMRNPEGLWEELVHRSRGTTLAS